METSSLSDAELEPVVEILAAASRILFITGAGLSADSGLPTYRGIGGLYEDRLTDDEMPIEVALSGETLRTRPDVSWKYLHEIARACLGRRPNAGHERMASIERIKPETWVLTQNVDGFHHMAGSRNLMEIHGRIEVLYCLDCRDRTTINEWSGQDPVPRCPRCGGLVRPDVVLFGEALPDAVVRTLESELRRGFDLVFSVGTSSLFPYIAEPVYDARRRGVPSVEINPASTPVSPIVEYRLRGRAEPVLDALYRAAFPEP